MNIIFLDIDGVLNSLPYFVKVKNENLNNDKDLCDEYIKRLSKIYHFSNSRIVLSSTWRELKDDTSVLGKTQWNKLIDTLTQYNMCIHDITPTLQQNRPAEIRQWLNEHRQEVKNFVILDDDYAFNEYQEYQLGDYLVKTSFYGDSVDDSGLQDSHVNKALKILNGGI